MPEAAASTAIVEASSSLRSAWPHIRAVWNAMPIGAFATVGADGSPQVTPIGSVYLDPNEPKGYYHPIFASRLRRNLGNEGRFELLFLDLRARTWLPALIRGRFNTWVASRLAEQHVAGAVPVALPNHLGARCATIQPVEQCDAQLAAPNAPPSTIG
jgi:predicted pyridoxine 5'-phosphate oxidase superfamily flavin-nucleotide-binding protein